MSKKKAKAIKSLIRAAMTYRGHVTGVWRLERAAYRLQRAALSGESSRGE